MSKEPFIDPRPALPSTGVIVEIKFANGKKTLATREYYGRGWRWTYFPGGECFSMATPEVIGWRHSRS